MRLLCPAVLSFAFPVNHAWEFRSKAFPYDVNLGDAKQFRSLRDFVHLLLLNHDVACDPLLSL